MRSNTMARSVSAARYYSGFSLIEAAIVLGVIGLVIGGIWAATSSVTSKKNNDDVRTFIAWLTPKLDELTANGNPVPSNSYMIEDVLVKQFPTPPGGATVATLDGLGTTYVHGNMVFLAQSCGTSDDCTWILSIFFINSDNTDYSSNPPGCSALMSYAMSQWNQTPGIVRVSYFSATDSSISADYNADTPPTPDIATLTADCRAISVMDIVKK